MSERTKNFAFGAVGLLLAGVLVGLVVTNNSTDDRVERIGTQIKCPVCQGESIADSPATMAEDMMALVEERVASGSSDDEIIDELLSSFSGAVLLDPPVSGATLLLWLLPLIGAGVGLTVIFWWKNHPDRPEQSEEPAQQRSLNRSLTGGLVLIGGFAAIVIFAGFLIQDRAEPNEGAADVNIESLDDVSNDTMEAVIAANLDDPQIDGMRLAIAERYFTAGDYRSAFPHFLAVAQSPTADPNQATLSLVRLGWMAYDGNGEVGTAIDLFDQALEVTPDSPVTLYLKGQVLWCGSGDAAAATDLFEQVLSQPNITATTRDSVEEDLERVGAGEDCT